MMRFNKFLHKLLLGCGVFLLCGSLLVNSARAAETAPAPAAAEAESAGDNVAINEAELAQMLAPIALYPDSLLMQMLMAATYPLEVVEAARFVKANPKLKEDALDKALKDKDWDESVKSICHFPTVLKSMNEHLDATKKLGDFFLEDQKKVMDTIQDLRAKAREAGKLKTTKEQKVIVEEKTIVIEPADPKVVYVPTYSSTVVYGSWSYPAYPPYAWYPPPPVYGFAAGVAVGAWAANNWCHADWHHGDIDIDVNRNVNVNRPGGGTPRTRTGGGGQTWKHNPQHRKGVSYRNSDVRKRYGQSGRNARQRDLARGYGKGMDRKTRDNIKRQGLKSGNSKFGQSNNRKATRPAANQSQRARTTGNTSSRSSQVRNQGSSSRKASANRSSQTRNSRQSSANRSRQNRSSSAFQRSGSGRSVSRSSSRGRASRSFGGRSGGRRR